MRARLAVWWRMESARVESRLISACWRVDQLGQAVLVGGPGLAVLGVGALVLDELGLVEVEHPGDGLVEQVQVVADDEQGAAVGPQEAHQPVLGVAVEVVGRLVEQQHVAAGEEDAGQLHPAALAPGQHAEGQVDAVGAQAEAGDQLAHLGLGGVAAEGREGVLGPGEAGDGPVGGVLLHGDPQLLQPGGGLVQAPARTGCGPGRCRRWHGGRREGPGSGSRAGPWTVTVPAAAGASPPSTLSRLVLPAPLRPTRPTLSPARTRNDASSRVRRPPTSTLSWRASSTPP